MRRVTVGQHRQGQTLVEIALLMPLFLTVVLGLIVLGIGLFLQQQVDNAARETARYAAIHSATSDCPTRSNKLYIDGMVPVEVLPGNPNCDPPPNWPLMTAHARRLVFAIEPTNLDVTACWSGYVDHSNPDAYDSPPRIAGVENDWEQCTIGGIDPLTNLSALPCPAPTTTETDDKASNMAYSGGVTANRVTAYVCYEWSPPLAGFLLIPETVTLRAAITEAMQHQR
jgi:hypothetical protein